MVSIAVSAIFCLLEDVLEGVRIGGCPLSPDRGRTDCGHLWPDIFAPVVVASLLFSFLLRDGFDSHECHFLRSRVFCVRAKSTRK